MATLAVDKPRPYENTNGHPDYNEIPIIASDTIFNGAAVGMSGATGNARPLVAADNFAGFCVEQCANEGGAASAKLVKVLYTGVAWLTVTGVSAITGYGVAVYASDDDTFTTASTGNSQIGKVKRYDSASGKTLVDFEAVAARSI